MLNFSETLQWTADGYMPWVKDPHPKGWSDSSKSELANLIRQQLKKYIERSTGLTSCLPMVSGKDSKISTDAIVVLIMSTSSGEISTSFLTKSFLVLVIGANLSSYVKSVTY